MIPRVWAPSAKRVSFVIVDRLELAMTRDDGWWTVDEDFAGEFDYGFLVDDHPGLLPDPRSRRQPTGVEGPSRTFDANAFEWTDDRWTGRQLPGCVLYELHIGTFTVEGTLSSAIEGLDHLVDLGVDAVELLPVNAFDGDRNWGYDGVLWFAVHEAYGGPLAYQRFVDACHARGLAVIQDVVYNHLGPSGNSLPYFGPYVREDESSRWGAAINLAAEEVRRYIIDNAEMWFRDYHVDGLRLDAVHALAEPSPKHLLQELAEAIEALSVFLRRPLFLIAESDLNDPRVITPREAGGFGIDAQWNDDFHHAVHVALTSETAGYYADFEHLDALAKVLTRGFFHDGTFSSYRGRIHGRPIDVDNTATWRLVVADQDHDQIGNRARGDRLSATLDCGQLAIAAVLTLTAPFTPMLFMGEEWGASTPWQFFASHRQPELDRATTEGRLAEFASMGWDPADVPDPHDAATFQRSKLDWSERHDGDHARLLAIYKSLIRLRRTIPDLTEPRFHSVRVEFDADARWMVIGRGRVTIAVNFSERATALPADGSLLLATSDDVRVIESGVALPPHSAAITTN
jgi:maltooligosyltrehalose trehalohydrolase